MADGKLVCVVRDVTARRRQEDALSALHEATRAFMEAPDEEAIADIAVETARTTLELPLSGLWIHDDEADALTPLALTDEAAALLDDPPTYTAGESLSWQAFQQNTLEVYDDVRAEQDRLNEDTMIRSEMIVPLGDHGVMNFGATETAEFSAIDRSLARILGNTVEAALSRAAREQQLRTQRRELERQNDRLANFTSVVSHDLRNPLNVAQTRLELAQDECSTPHLDAATDALTRMETLIDDLLTLAREGEPVDETEALAIDAIVQRCWSNVETAEATLQVTTDRTVLANRNRLQQLFENLISNAVAHGGPGVTVSIGAHDDGFYVADDGVGIPPDERDDVLEPGYTTGDEGTGFGLQIVREIVEAHDWELRVTDSDAGGARFEIGDVEMDPG
jgi:signal transduction histidine kinase